MRKKFLAMIVALAMLFTLLPANPAFAGPGDTHTIIYAPGAQGLWNSAAQTYHILYGNPTPNFTGSTASTFAPDWHFAGWSPMLTPTVTGDKVYTASWYLVEQLGGNNEQKLTYIVNDELTITLRAWGNGNNIRFEMTVIENGVTSVSPTIPNTGSGTFNQTVSHEGISFIIGIHGNTIENLGNLFGTDRYTVIYDSGGHGIFTTGETSQIFIGVPVGSATPPAPTVIPDTGWKFNGWDPQIALTVTGDVTYTAQYLPIGYTVRFNSNAGDATGMMSDQSFLFDVAQNLNKNIFVRIGYKFGGWSTTTGGSAERSDEENVINLSTVDGEIINLYAVWEVDESQTKELSYQVNYYLDGVFEEAVTETVTVWINATVMAVQPVDTSDTRYIGYKFDSTDPDPIPATIADGGEIDVYYIKDDSQTKDLSYTVNYYLDGVFEEAITETVTVWINATEMAVQPVDTADTRYIGYQFDSTDPDPIPATIADGGEIKVYYIPDYDDTNELSYTIEYYKDITEMIATDTTTGNVWVAAPQVLTVQTVDTGKYRPLGYKFDSTDPDPIPATIADGGVIKVYYVPDYDDTNELSYSVEYYKYTDLIATDIFTEDVWVAAPQIITVQTVNTEKYLPIGYAFDRTEPDPIPATITDGGVIKVYYITVVYDIDYDLDGGINDADNPDSYTVEDLPITVADASKAGYNFLGWTSDELAIYTAEIEPVITTGTTGNILFSAVWSDAIVYNITYILNGGANAPGNPSTYTVEDGLITLDDPARAGYNFAGWTPTDNIPAGSTGDREFTAVWTARDDILVTFDANGGAEADPLSKYVTFDSEYGELAVTSRTGYNFLGWFTALEGGVEVTSETIVTNADDHILYARWAARDDILVTFNAGGGSTPNPESKFVTFDNAYGALATTSRSGYNFLGWYTEGGVAQVTPETIVAIADNHTLYARWQTVSNPPRPGPGGDTPIPPAVVAPTPTPSVIIDDEQPGAPVFISDHVAYIIGYEDGTARPEKNVTRAEVATVFYRLLTEEMRKSNWTIENSFPDVASDSWYNVAVSVNSMMGVIQGYPDGTFKPDESITRAELAAIAARFARAMSMRGDNDVGFNDISGHWAEADIRHAAIIGWVKGYPDNSFKPDQPITRAEFITLANNVLGRIPETVDDLFEGEMTVWSDNADVDAWYYIAIQEATNSHLYSYKDGQTVPGMQFEYETWTALQQNWDWIQLEKDWIAAYSTP